MHKTYERQSPFSRNQSGNGLEYFVTHHMIGYNKLYTLFRKLRASHSSLSNTINLHRVDIYDRNARFAGQRSY